MTSQLGSLQLGSHGEDEPVVAAAIASNLRPAEIRAVSCLAEDTVFAQGVEGSPIQVVPFRDPFTGVEEVLFVTPDKTLWHAARGTGAAQQGSPGAGWEQTKVSANVTSVVPVVHPNGCVYAICTTQQSAQGGPGYLAIWELAGFDSESGVPIWGRVDDHLPDDFDEVRSVFVHYLDDRISTPVIFALMDNPLTADGKVATIFGSRDNRVQPWEPRSTYVMPQSQLDGVFAIGYDDASLAWLRIFSVEDGQLWQSSYHTGGEHSHGRLDTNWASGIGGFSGPSGFGAVGVSTTGDLRVLSWVEDAFFKSADVQTLPLPSSYRAFRLWQDAAGLMHLYATDNGEQLNVLHQTGWQTFVAGGKPKFPPTWDTTLLPNGQQVAAMRPLVGSVDEFGLDPHPDNMPSQCVFHHGAGPEAMEILTQQLGTDYWESEVVRVAYTLADNLTPYLAPRYKTQVTVLDAGGCRVPLCALTVTADAPVDLEVKGTLYRLRPSVPVTLTTDMAGSLTLKIAARGLATPNVHVSAQGVLQALTLQPAAEVHKFLAGAGLLPTHPGGLTAEALEGAKTPSGSPLFPILQSASDATDDWPPTSADVLAWLQGAFAVSAKTALPAAMTSRLADGEEVLGFTLQTHDRSRPAVEVFTSLEQLAEHRGRIGASAPDPSMQEWFCDVVEGVRSSAVRVGEVSVDIVHGTITGVVELAAEATKAISGFWDDAVSAAHCVELIFSALGAQIGSAVSWLTWPLSFADVWWTKECMEGLLEDVMSKVKSGVALLQEQGTKWSLGADKMIDDAVAAAAEVFGGQYTGRFERPSMDPSTMPSGFNSMFPSMPDWWPHLGWFQELLDRFTIEIPFDDTGNPIDELVAKLEDLPQWTAFESTLTTLGQDIRDVFDPTNPHTWSQILVTAFVNAAADLAKDGIALAVAAFDALCDFLTASADLVTDWYSTKVIDIPGLAKVWNWIQEQAGISPDAYESITYGRAAMFLWCYPGTVGFKVFYGAKPFKDGAPTLAELKEGARAMAQPEKHVGEPPVPGVVYPPFWPAHAVLQYFCAHQMTADAAFDWKVNNEALCKAAGTPYVKMGKTELCIWAFLHQLAYGLGDMPYVWGNDMYDPATSMPDEWGPSVMWFMSLIANSADVGVAAKWGAFVNSFEEAKSAGHTYSILAIGRIIISFLRYFYGEDDRGYSFAIWNCSINVTSFISAIGWPRWMLLDDDIQKKAVWAAIVWGKARVDSVCDAFAGIASVEQIVFESFFPPRISAAPIKATFKKKDAVSLSVQGHLGVLPYQWAIQPPEVVPPGATGGLPEWLEIVRDDKNGKITFVGEASEAGTWVFDITMADDYGPTFRYELDGNTIAVTSSEA